MIVIIDYGMGNVGSIINMMKKIGVKDVRLTSDVSTIEAAERIILPGVGAFDTGMRRLKELGIIPLLNRQALELKKPILGVCLGMQLIMNSSEEGVEAGLGWIAGDSIRFRFESQYSNFRIPHMGWNTLRPTRSDPIFENLPDDPRFYFVHSYHVLCSSFEDVSATTSYGYEFISVVRHENILGMQFHPEKSHKFGMALLRNFVELI